MVETDMSGIDWKDQRMKRNIHISKCKTWLGKIYIIAEIFVTTAWKWMKIYKADLYILKRDVTGIILFYNLFYDVCVYYFSLYCSILGSITIYIISLWHNACQLKLWHNQQDLLALTEKCIISYSFVEIIWWIY